MKELALYQLEVALCLAVLSGMYLLFWRNETNFLLKRFLLISIPLLSIVIPLLNFDITVTDEQPIMEFVTYIPNQIITQSNEILTQSNEFMMQSDVVINQAPSTINTWHIIYILWILGAFLMLLRLGVSLLKIRKIVQQAEWAPNGKYKLVDDPIQSFSFFNLIVINKYQVTSNAKEHILAHELAHSQQGHSYDVVFLELIKVIQWFNPFIWMLSHSSKQNLEFLADQAATTYAEDKEPYQFAIVHHAANSGYQLLKTQFSKANLKSRIIMMNQPNNRKIHLGKSLIILPLLSALLMSFSLNVENLDLKKELTKMIPLFNPETQNLKKSSNFSPIDRIDVIENEPADYSEIQYQQDTSKNEVFKIVENQPQPSTGDMTAYFEVLKQELNYPAEAKANNIKGKVFVAFTVQKDGTLGDVKAAKGLGYGCDEEAVRVISEGPIWIPGEQQGKKVNVRMILPIPFGINYPPPPGPIKGIVKNTDGEPIVGCNVIIEGTTLGTVTNPKGVFQITPYSGIKIINLIVSSRGYTTEVRHAPYGSSHAIELTRIDENTESRKLSGTIKSEDGNPVIGCNVIIRGTTTGTVTDGDGRFLIEVQPESSELIFSYVGLETEIVKISEDSKYAIIMKADPEYPSSPQLKDLKVVVGYPTDVNNIEYKPSIRSANSLNDLEDDARPLIILDGKEMIEMSEIDHTEIHSMTVLKDKSAVSIYGDNGVNGVILITTKEAKSKESVYTDVTIYDDNNKDGLKLKTDGNLDFGEENPPIYFVDEKETSQEEVEKIDPSTIQSIEVIKGKPAKEKYGKKGKDGVILIKLKK